MKPVRKYTINDQMGSVTSSKLSRFWILVAVLLFSYFAFHWVEQSDLVAEKVKTDKLTRQVELLSSVNQARSIEMGNIKTRMEDVQKSYAALAIKLGGAIPTHRTKIVEEFSAVDSKVALLLKPDDAKDEGAAQRRAASASAAAAESQ